MDGQRPQVRKRPRGGRSWRRKAPPGDEPRISCAAAPSAAKAQLGRQPSATTVLEPVLSTASTASFGDATEWEDPLDDWSGQDVGTLLEGCITVTNLTIGGADEQTLGPTNRHARHKPGPTHAGPRIQLVRRRRGAGGGPFNRAGLGRGSAVSAKPVVQPAEQPCAAAGAAAGEAVAVAPAVPAAGSSEAPVSAAERSLPLLQRPSPFEPASNEPCPSSKPAAAALLPAPALAPIPPQLLRPLMVFGAPRAHLAHPGVSASPTPLAPLQPIMVFGANCMAVRMQDWVADTCAFNAIQTHLKLMSGSDFVPLCPVCPVVQVLLMRAGLFPQTTVSAAARFQELLEALPQLQTAAAEQGVWRFGQVAVMGPEGRLQVVGYAPEAMSFGTAGPLLRMVFVACAFHEANRQESGPGHATLTVAADGILAAPRVPTFGLGDLQDWLSAAAGSPVVPEAAAEMARLAAPACGRVDGALIVA